MTELQDFQRAYLLLGQYAGEPVLLAATEDGSLYSLAIGQDEAGNAIVLRTDDAGRLVMIPLGESGNYLDVDENGYLTIIAKGEDGTSTLRSLAVDTSGQLIMVPRGQGGNYLDVDSNGFLTIIAKGQDDTPTLRTIAVDSDGQLIMVPRGQGGNYLDVDESGYLTIVTKGETAVSELKTLRTDDSGRLIMVPMGESENYLYVDEDGYLTMIPKGDAGGGVLKSLAVDSSGRLIMIPRGQSGYYLNVDSDGYMTTVIKGNYDGTLKTVKTDGQGRLSAFIIDSVDAWGNLLSVGNAELAARLGSPNVFDQRGRVQFLETFASGIARWVTSTNGTGASVDIDPATFQADGYSVCLTGGSDGLKYSRVDWRGGPMTVAKSGVSLAFAMDGTFDTLWVEVTIYDGTYQYIFGMTYDDQNEEFSYINNVGTEVKIADISACNQNKQTYTNIKIVGDLDAGEYVRAQFNDSEWDISGNAFYKGASAARPQARIRITLYSRAGNNDVAYIDSIILTNAEPA
jgi:hypothetical protein